jgi:hypothetical protein
VIKTSWNELKNYYDVTICVLHYLEHADFYTVYVHNGDFQITTILTRDGNAEVVEFETDYKDKGNVSLVDVSGRTLTRIAATTSGWHFEGLGVDYETSKLASFYCSDADGNDLGVGGIKFYNNADVELVAGTQAELDANCVKTVIDIQIPWDLDLIRGRVLQAKATQAASLWTVFAPHIPVESGGSKRMITNLNLCNVEQIAFDGKAALRVTHDPINNSNLQRVTIKHALGYNHKGQIFIEGFEE